MRLDHVRTTSVFLRHVVFGHAARACGRGGNISYHAGGTSRIRYQSAGRFLGRSYIGYPVIHLANWSTHRHQAKGRFTYYYDRDWYREWCRQPARN